MSTEDKVLRIVSEILHEIEKEPAGGVHPQLSLLGSGLFDSHSTLTLALWIEDEIGREIELGDLDLVEVWDTPARIVSFIEKNR